jgi:hypothetical protein
MKPEPKFKKSDSVIVSASCLTPELRGRTCTVRRVFWAQGNGGQGAGWVCETDIPFGIANRFYSLWESLLEPAPSTAETTS